MLLLIIHQNYYLKWVVLFEVSELSLHLPWLSLLLDTTFWTSYPIQARKPTPEIIIHIKICTTSYYSIICSLYFYLLNNSTTNVLYLPYNLTPIWLGQE